MTEWGAARRLFLFRGSVIETLGFQREAENPMITEIAQIDVKPGTEKDFEAAVAKARPLFLRAKGGKGFELHKSIEKPQRYRLMAKWETLENHTVDFRGSEDFAVWRGLVGQYFAAPPEVEHTETVLTSAG
jgi:heme-degrading monooxygenase HmoA